MKIKKLDHLSEIYEEYDAFLIDLWGVMHNGIRLNPSAMNAVRELEEKGKKVIFLSNAPRPTNKVIKFLKKLNMQEKYLKNVLTSGEAAIKSLKENKFGKKFYHLGPERDDSLFIDIKQNKTSLEKCDFILCTGLFDNEYDNLKYYQDLLRDFTKKKLVCTNPDLIVHRGEEEEYCAGKIAEIFEKMGGEVIYFGKPHPEVYNLSIDNNNKKILAIGDNLNTDIRGANLLNYDSLLISNGIHKDEIKKKGIENVAIEYESIVNYIQSDLKW